MSCCNINYSMNRRDFLKSSTAGLGLTMGLRPEILRADPPPADGLRFWLETSLRRVFPASPARDARTLRIVAARGERLSFQACVR